MPLSAGGSRPLYSQKTPGIASGSAECGSKAAGTQKISSIQQDVPIVRQHHTAIKEVEGSSIKMP